MKPIFRKWLLPGSLLISTFVLDFLGKSWANSHLHYGQPRDFCPGLMRLTLTRNAGAAFGLGRGQGWLMTIIACIIICVITFWLYRRENSQNPPNQLERCGIGIILGGALGNLFERLTRGEVTDFLEFSFIQFPVFNLADALIDTGAALVIIGTLFFSSQAIKKCDISE